MSDHEIECRVTLTHADFIMANHRVHGVSVLPGVTFLDIVYRILIARGIDVGGVELRNILFAEAVTTRAGYDRELRVSVGRPVQGVRPVRVDSRWLHGGEECAPWRENVRAEIADATGPEPAVPDIAVLKAGAVRRNDMDLIYARTRREDIIHGTAMRCFGQLYGGEEYLLADLRLHPSTRDHEDAFHLHPAKLDASTLVAFGQTDYPDDRGYIPFFIERFRAPRPLTGAFHTYVPRPELPSASGELLRNDYLLLDGDGRFVAEFQGLSCKRIRHPELITKLPAEVDGEVEPPPRIAPPSLSEPADAAVPAEPVEALVRYLRAKVAGLLGREAADVPTDAGFYDLGLDSVALLRISGELESVVGATLYPTLLFEYGDIGRLADHLAASYEIRLDNPGSVSGPLSVEPTAPNGSTVDFRARCFRDVWVAQSRPVPVDIPDLVLFDATDRLIAALRHRARRMVTVSTGAGFARTGPESYRLDPQDRAQLDELLDALCASGALPTRYAFAAGGSAQALWALAAALVDRRPIQPVTVVVAAGEPVPPERAAIGALAATIQAEVPLLRCRVVELDAATDLPDALLAEVVDDGTEARVRYRTGIREVCRWLAAELPTAAPSPFRAGGGYLVTGGAGGIAGLLTEHLVTVCRARVVLLGRGPCPEQLTERIAGWQAGGGEVFYIQADVARADEVRAAVAGARERLGRIDGVLHCAGTVHDGLFFRRSSAELAATGAPKVAGTAHLDEATRDDDLDLFALFSSLAGVVPNPGQADYAYANAFQYHFARTRRGPGRTLAVAWPLWAEGGMQVPADAVRQSYAATGMAPMPTATGIALLARGLAAPHDSFAVIYGDPARIGDVLPEAPVVAARAVHQPVPIAVIGVAGRYPGADDLDEFWRNLTSGRDSITEIPSDRWDHDSYFDPDQNAAGRTYSRWGGFLDGVDRFDPAFFGISRRDAERMDPQERLFLMTGWRTFEDAGYPPQALAGETVGVFVGVMWNHYQLVTGGPDGVAPTAMHASVANRVSYCLNLHGPSMAVDTACSSSLTAVHLAVESLRRGESTMALAGGVNVSVHPQKYLQLAQGQFLSADGRCRSFGADGTGYVPGEGVGAVLLKPVDRAIADGDHIYGLIPATVLNHTGRTSGFTVPSPTSQGALVRGALEQAGWDPASVGYLEAHGTGTALGDPIEVDGLRQAFAGAAAVEGECAIGSVKSNIGHLESAAGVAGLTKVLLQLRHRELVPSLHSGRVNPHLELAGTPFRVQQIHQPWPAPAGGRRRAGVSAFGAGGANAHVLVEEAPELGPAPAVPAAPRLFVLSARDRRVLREYAGRFVDLLVVRPTSAASTVDAALAPATTWLAAMAAELLGIPVDAIGTTEPLADLGFDATALRDLAEHTRSRWACRVVPTPDTTLAALAQQLPGGAAAVGSDARYLADLTYTLQVGRTSMAHRLAVVALDPAGLHAVLSRYLAGEPAGADGVWDVDGPGPVLEDPVAAFRAGRLHEVAAHWAAGAEIDWSAGNADAIGLRRMPLPTYPFAEERCWIGNWRGGRPPVPPALVTERADPRPPPRRAGTVAVSASASVDDPVELRVLEPGIALITMRDSTGNNMFTDAMMRGLQRAFADVAGRADARVVVITGAGSVFCMGATAQALETLAGGGSQFTDAPFVYEGMLRCDKPVIAAVQGHASGGGLAFGLYADLVVMSREGSYSANFMKYGITPGMGATYILEQRFGRTLAAEMFFTGRQYTGTELEGRGANVAFAEPDEVLPIALSMARSVTDKLPHAVTALKRDLAARTLDQLAPVIARESAMHETVLGPESVARIKQHFEKVNGYRVAGPPEAANPAAVPVPESLPDPESPDRAALTRVVEQVLCASLYLDPDEIDLDRSFSDMGLDSIGAVELTRVLNREFGLDIDSVAVYDHPTVPHLVDHVEAVLARDRTLVRAAVAPPAPPADPPPRAAPIAPAPAAAPVPATAVVSLRPLDNRPQRTLPPARITLRSTASAPVTGSVAGTAVPIAVIGMAGRFPDAPDLDAFWRNLSAGRDSVREVPAARWDIGAFFDPDRHAAGRTYSKWAALLSDVDAFDAAFFRISPLEATAMDPQQRLFLQTAWAAIEDAGYAGTVGPRRWGVFVGCAPGDYVDLLRRAEQDETAHAFLGNSGSVLAARIAYLLDLTGPTMAVDTACSSSLVATHLACESIRAGECDSAVAGGVALMLTPRMHVLTSKTGMLSPTGRCAPFDASADGIVLGEGSGAILLKRLDRALADGDQVHGVIAASGVNGDGRTNGITAPSAASQAELMERVHRLAGIHPDDVTYVEAHGTGTPLGDPIEVRALDRVLGAGGADCVPCGLGSVKSNIGHTTLAAGIAGLLKVLLALRHRTLPPSINFTEPNPEIDFGRSRLRPVREAQPWQPGRSGRLVGVLSSFGFSGTNAHVVIGEPPQPSRREEPTADAGPYVVPVSARTEAALARTVSRLADRLSEPDRQPALADVAYTLSVGRAHLPVRAAAVVADHAELLAWLRSPLGEPTAGPSQAATIARAYAAGEPVDWAALYRDRPGRRVALPTYPFEDERHWVSNPATPVTTPTTPTSPSPPGTLDPADWIVAEHRVGGIPLLPGVAALERAAEAVRAGTAGPVRVSGVQWLRPIEVSAPRRLSLRLDPRADGTTRFEISDGLDGSPCYTRGRVDLMVAGAGDEVVDIAAAERRCPDLRSGADIYPAFAAAGIEYGPSFQVLDSVRYGPHEALGILRLSAVRGAEVADRPLHPAMLDAALQTIAVLAGATDGRPYVPFALASFEAFGAVPTAGYSYVTRDKGTYAVRLTDEAGRVRVRFTGLALRAAAPPSPSVDDGMCFEPVWRDAAPVPDPAPSAHVPVGVLIVHDPDSVELASALVAAHEATGDRADLALWPSTMDRSAGVDDAAPDHVYFLADIAGASGNPADGAAPPLALYRTVQALRAHSRSPLTLTVVTAGAMPAGDSRVRPAAAGLPGFARSVAAEHPQWTVHCVDVEPDPGDLAGLAERLRREPVGNRLVAYRGGRRLARVVERMSPARPTSVGTVDQFRPGGVYLVVGGTGGIGAQLCRHLASSAGARLAIVGRRPLDSAVTEQLAELGRLGGSAIYCQADVADPVAFGAALARTRADLGSLNGAFHAALVLRDRSLVRMTERDLIEVLAPKVAGAVAFGEALATEPLDFLMYFSSAVSFTDAAGQANYAAASTFEDAYAAELRGRCAFPVQVVNWGYWGSVGAVAGQAYAGRMAELGVRSIEPADGIAALTDLLRAGTPQALVVKADAAGLARLGVTTAPAAVVAARAAFADLERLACDRLSRAFDRLGALPEQGRSVGVAELHDRLRVVPAMSRLLDALLGVLVAGGAVRRDGDRLTGTTRLTDAPSPADVMARHPDLSAHIELLERCVAALPRVLDGSVGATEVLFPKGNVDLIERVYRGQSSADVYHRLLSEEVADALRAAGGSTVRILEIGAGTGASSEFVLPACADQRAAVVYHYTDISSAFLRRGADRFAEAFPFVEFHRLDIERDPLAQGFASHTYDVVLATNVLHATARIDRTLEHVHGLLRPGGVLLVNEVTRAAHFLTLTFGLTPGWWRFTDPEARLAHGPLLSPVQWRRALAAAGFGTVAVRGFAGTVPEDLEQCLLVARVEPAAAAPAGTGERAALGGDDGPAARDYVRRVFAEVLRFREDDLGDRVTFENFGVDSLVSLDIVTRFERDLGPLPATLLFEHLTIERLAGHLLAEHADRLGATLAPTEPAASSELAASSEPAFLSELAASSEPATSSELTASSERATSFETAVPLEPASSVEPVVRGRAAPAAAVHNDVAVIAVAGRYPGAADVDAFWRLLAEGRSGITEVPPQRWDWREHFDSRPGTPQRTYSRWGGFLDGVDQFDPSLFGILPRDAENIDPQERLFLETAWSLLEQSGHLGEYTRVPETGVFVGTMYGSYGQLGAAEWANGTLTGAHSAYWSIANRVSYVLDLHGPSFAVDSACSSSLLAVHLAAEAIRRGECRMAIAGGVNVILHPAHFVALSSLNMLSADGRCKVFDARADGFVPGEGVGAVLLKPLGAAIADGDAIWGVLKGGAVNAGGKTGGYTVPNPDAQAAVVAAAIARAGIDSATIGYVEAHGTGTNLGDPIEVASLQRALGVAPDADGVRCAIGSVKANVGHLEGAAGIAGLTKVLLQLRHGQLAPCVNLDTVNPKIGLDPARCYLPDALATWPVPKSPVDGQPLPRRAGISSFGAGGANVHIVVEEYPTAPGAGSGDAGREFLFVLSARTRERLSAYAAEVAAFLDGPADLDFAGLCHSSQLGRRELSERLAVVATDRANLARQLRTAAEGRAGDGVWTATADRRGHAADTAPAGPLSAVAAAWVRGAYVDWRELWPGPAPHRVAFPTYPFERRRYWLRTGAPDGGVPAGPAEPAQPLTFQRPAWEPARLGIASVRPTSVLVLTRDTALAAAFAEELPGALVTTAADGPDAVVFDLTGDLAADLDRLLDVVRAALAARPDGAVRVLATHTTSAPEYAAVTAALRTLALEHTRFSGARVQLDAAETAAERASRLIVELGSTDPEVCYRDGQRLARRMVEFTPLAVEADPAALVRSGATYLVTGGAGALGRHFAEFIAGAGGVTVVLAGRSAPTAELLDRVAALSAGSAQVIYQQADVSTRDGVRDLIAAAQRHGPLRGVIHAAGVVRNALASRKDRADIDAVLAPKVTGAALLDEATQALPLDFFVLFSSVVAETGNPGQYDYAAANAYLHAFAARRDEQRQRGERHGRTVAIGWPLWAEGGMTVDAATRRLFARKWSMVPMSTASGVSAFVRGLATDETSFCVVAAAAADNPSGQPAPAVADPPAVAAPTAVPVELLREAAQVQLRQMASTFLLVACEEVALGDDLMETGFDSISLTELINQINERYALDLLPTVLFECATLGAFAEYLVRHHAPELAAVEADPTAESAAGPSPSTVEERTSVAAVGERTLAVAVVGIAGVLPGSPDLASFWTHLSAGADLVGPPPADRLELLADPQTAAVRAGFIDDVAGFDAELFRISRTEAALMDPQQRLFLQAAWRAIEDAGYRPDAFAGTDTGLFVGVSTTDYADLLRSAGVPVEAHTASGVAHSILANRVSHVLDLTGPSEAVDTACSSSLVAMHRAVQAIAAGDCTAAIVGGVNVLLSPGLFTAFSKSGMLSPRGASRTFDAGADGYARGEGVGAVLVKPLAAARADGDHIYAVIRGTAVNHGGRATSLTAPNPEAQARVLVKAYRAAGVDPRTVTAIEAHGTGTRLGDPIEIEGLKKAFTQLYREWDVPAPEQQIAVGSVKTNIGHLEAAAGIAGVLKMLLAMRHAVLPPTVHYSEPNPYLRLDGTPFFINDRARPWTGATDVDGPAVYRAGISSFGFGGSNAHVVLESYPAPEPIAVGPQLLVLSGADPPALRRYVETVADFLAADPDIDLARVAYTLQTGRATLACRLAVVAVDRADAVNRLRTAAGGADGPPIPSTVDGLAAVAARWLDGADVDWDELWAGGRPRRTSVPGVPFSTRAYWFDDRAEPPPTERVAKEHAVPETTTDNGRLTMTPRLRTKVTLAAVTVPLGAVPPVPVVRADVPPSHESDPAPCTGPALAAVDLVRAAVADIVGLAPDEVAGDASFADLGLDSIFRMDLAKRLNAQFPAQLQAADLYEHDTVEELATFIAESAGSPVAEPAQTEPIQAERVQAEPSRTEPVLAEPARTEPVQTPAGDVAGPLADLVRGVVDRPLDPARSFVDNGFTSFDMLRVISALERRFGALRKTLLFDCPTLAELAAHLVSADGHAAAFDRLSARPDRPDAASGPVRLVPAPTAPAPGPDPSASGGHPLIVRKRELGRYPDLTDLLAGIDRQYAKEGGLAGRDIAPLAFIGADRRAYFNFSRRDESLFAWSYTGSEEDFPGLVVEWLDYAHRHALRPNFLSLLPLTEAGGVPLNATPFGAVQRIDDLADFTLSGGRMTRLRYMVHRFTRSGECVTAEYAVGSASATDREIVDMIGQWGDQKQMVNPYVDIVRDELRRGELEGRHRFFLTRVDGELVNVIIITKIHSERGWLLDLEFYPRKAPTGGLEYAICAILDTLRHEGSTLFSFGASFGVKVCESPNADPAAEAALAELRSVGIFGVGNFQFKNKFRPVNLPIFLCQRADEDRTGVSDVVLMIANPDLAAEVPGLLGASGGDPVKAPESAAEPDPVAPASPGRTSSPSRTASPSRAPITGARVDSGRSAVLAAEGYNPLRLAHSAVEVDLLTDSWAELDGPAIVERGRTLAEAAAQAADPVQFPAPDWLSFDLVVPTPSGRAAEALLCRNWPGPAGIVVHNGLFPTWALNLADAGFSAVQTPVAAGAAVFKGDLDLVALRERLAADNGAVALVSVELSGNAGGGYPISLANLHAVRESASTRRVPLVLDATRIMENAAFIAAHEEGQHGRGGWEIVHELLGLADAVTMSLSKDFGLSSGGLVAARSPVLVERLQEYVALRGRQVSLFDRKIQAAALADRQWIEDRVRARMDAVAEIWTALADAGAPVGDAPGGHCVVLDVGAIPEFAGLVHPVASCLAWIYAGTGVRGGPHMAAAGQRIRLAVPLGLPVAHAREVGAALARLWRDPHRGPDLIPLDPSRAQRSVDGPAGLLARYHPAEAMPDDIGQAMREGHRPSDDNIAVLRELAGPIEHTVLGGAGGNIEVFTAGAGPAVLLMHPFNIGAGIFGHLFARLAEHYRVITVHHPGVGTTTAAGDLSLEGIAGLYRTVLDQLGVDDPVAVAGASFGGLVAQTYALRYPDRTAALVLLGSSYKVGNRNGEVNRLSVVAREDFDRATADGGSERLLRDRDRIEQLLLRCESMDPQIGLSYLDVFAAQPTLLARLPDIAVPTLIVQGRHDTVIPRKTAHLLHGAIPEASYVEIDGAGHFPTLSHPDELYELLMPFLAAHLRTSGTVARP